MGKPKRENIWKHYRTHENKSVVCGFCEKQYKFPNVNKMEKHLAVCLKCPNNIKEGLKETASTSTSQEQNMQRDQNYLVDHTNVNKDTTAQAFSEDHKRQLHRALSNTIFVSGAPLAMVEHPAWLQFFELLQPLYKLPSRKTVSTKYLDEIHKDMHKNFSNEFEMQCQLHLQCDGWSSVKNEGIINFLVSKPEPVFVKSLDTKDNRHTGEYISQEILKIMTEYSEHKFVILVGDNAKNIQKAFQLVKNVHPHITYINCAAHTLNLLCQDVLQINVLNAFIGLAIDCIKSIKKSQNLTAVLKQIVKEKSVGETLKLPCKTRWGSHYTYLKSLENTKVPLQNLAVHERATNLRPEIKMTLLDEDFWKMNKQSMSIIEPIKDAIFKLESDQMNMHRVFITLRDMQSKLNFILTEIDIIEDYDKAKILTLTEKRMTMCIKPVHLAAYLLDPVLQGCELNETEEADAVEFLFNMSSELNRDVMPDLAKYKAKEGIWGKPFASKHVKEMSPVTWWKGLCGSTLLSKIALRILTAPCTSAAAERSFSTLSNVYTQKRNRLTSERAGKLAFISYNWNIMLRMDECSDSDTGEMMGDSDEMTEELPNSSSLLTNSTQTTEVEFFDVNTLCPVPIFKKRVVFLTPR